jgi:DNA-binding NarL/FixJ family response regulator
VCPVASAAIRVLIVDDDERFLHALTALLDAEGFEVIGNAMNGAQAVEITRSLKPDVVTLDLEMPVMSGIEATRQILALPDAPPIVIVSGSKSSAALDQALAAGARWHVEKRDAATALAPALRAAAAGPRADRKPT